MTKSRPALSVKRKQAALRATSSAAASNTKGNADSATWEKVAVSLQRTVDHQGQLLEAKSRSYEAMSDSEFSLRRELAAKEKLLTAALSEAEAWKGGQEELKNRIEELGVEMRNWAELHEKDAEELEDTQNKLYTARANYEKLLADNTDLHADQLLQANTLKALREELKLAKKDATDWALNHENERLRADEQAYGMAMWRGLVFVLLAVALGLELLHVMFGGPR